MAAEVGNRLERKMGLGADEENVDVNVSVGEVGPVDVVASVGVVMVKTLNESVF